MEPPRALVTGASSGIGAAFARDLRRRGWPLVLVARRLERLRELSRELGGEGVALPLAFDLAQAGAPERLHAELRQRGLDVELLVNNAGVGHTGRFHEESPERILEMIDLNARALVDLTRCFLPAMVERRRGGVIAVASTAAFQPVPYLAVYAATKAFVLSFTEALATELEGTGVRVQALCPGLTTTEFQQVAGTDRVAFNKTAAMTPEAVAAISLAAFERGRLRVIAGWSNRLSIAAQRLVPGRVVRSVAARFFRPT